MLHEMDVMVDQVVEVLVGKGAGIDLQDKHG